MSVEAYMQAGHVTADGTISASINVMGADMRTARSKLFARGIKNPSDAELALMLSL